MIKRITFLMLLASLVSAGTSMAQTLANPSARGVTAPVPKTPATPTVPAPSPEPKPGKANPNPIDEDPSPAASVKFRWSATNGLLACRGPDTCIQRPFPKSVGTPISVKRGPFLDKRHAPVSMLVVSKEQYSLCYLSSLKSDAVSECHRIKAPVIRGAQVRVISYHGKGTVLSYSLDPKEIKGKSREVVGAMLRTFNKAVREAQAATATSAARRYSGDLIPVEHMANEDDEGGGCLSDSDGGGWCDGGGGDGGGWNGGAGGGGDWGGDEPVETPDGGSGDEDQASISRIPPPPIGPAPDTSIEPNSCLITPNAAHCVIVTGNRDPDTGAELPSGPPPSDGDWRCSVPVIKWFFCGAGNPEPAPEPSPPAQVPPFQWPTRPDAADPLPRDEEGYREEADKCDEQRVRDEQACSLRYLLLGGPVYEERLARGEKLTAAERKMLREAKNDYSSCMTVTGDTWGQCYQEARKKFPR